jgi:hypothetical protein
MPELLTLTNGTDVASANLFTSGLVYTVGGDDRINALQDEDILTGIGTNPTLDATLGNANDNGARIITPKLNGIQTINVAFTGSGADAAVALDLQDATGVNAVNITRISQASNVGRVENIKQAVSSLSLTSTNANDATGVAEFSFGSNVLAGANTVNLKVSDVQVGTLNIGANNLNGVSTAGVGGQGYETINLESTGAANVIGTFNMPMDTGSAGVLKITGDKNLTLGQIIPVTNGATTTVESARYIGGVAQANGRLSAIDAAGLTGNLTLNITAGLLTSGKADTSGVAQNVSITGGVGNDTFILSDTVNTGDSITGGAGTDTLVVTSTGVVGTTSSVLSSIENVAIRAAEGGAVTVDFAKLPDAVQIIVRNEGANGTIPDSPAVRTLATTLTNLSAAQAAALTVQHSNTNSNGITQNTINATLASATGASDLVSLTIAEGLNNDSRFNMVLNAGTANNVESVTLVDSDTESNTVALAQTHAGTITLSGGRAGTFLNLDTTTAGANGGMYQYAVDGTADASTSNATIGRVAEMSGTAGQVRLTASTINAQNELSNVIVRVNSTGAQSITMGGGSDTVIFDTLNDNRAGLTISDTVVGGAGSDTLVIDGNVAISLGASEWTNVSGFETIRLVGNGAAANNAAGATNSYNLTLTNNMLAANKDANGILNIVSDNDAYNNTGFTAATVPVGNDGNLSSGGVTIDARTLSAGSKWSFKGNEGAGRSADRIILADANFDGNAVIDGGALDNITNNRGIASLDGTTVVGNATIVNAGNADVIEVRNAANIATGDLANIRNIGTLSFTNDLAVTQVSTLQLNDTIVDALVDSFQTSVSRAAVATQTTGGANVERLVINGVDNLNVAAATTGLTIEAGSLTDRSDLHINLGRSVNTVATGAGQDRVVLLGNFNTGNYSDLEAGFAINTQANNVAGVLAASGSIDLGAGTDTLVTYGGINLAGLGNLSTIEVLEAHSAVEMTAAQFVQLGTSLNFVGNLAHTLRIVGTGAETINLNKIALNGGSLIYQLVNVAGTTPGSVIADNSLVGDAIAGTVTAGTNNGGAAPVLGLTLTANAQPFNTTTGVGITGSSIAAAGDDTIVATSAQADDNASVINGAGGTNTLRLTTDATGVNLANQSTAVVNISRIELNAGATGNATMANIAGLNVVNTQTANASIVTLGNVAQTYTGSTGNDTVTLGAAGQNVTLNNGTNQVNTTIANLANSTVSGGAGADTLAVTDAGAVVIDAARVTGVDTISLSGASQLTVVPVAALTVTTDTGATTVTATGSGQTVTVTSNVADGTVLTLAGSSNYVVNTLIADLTSTATGTQSVTLGSAATKTITSTNTMTVVNGTAATGDTVTLAGAANYIVTGMIGSVDHTTGTGSLNVTTADDAGNAISISTNNTSALTVTAAAATDTVTINATALTTGTILANAGASNITVTNLTATGSVNLAAVTGISNVSGTTGNQTVTVGTGADIVNLGVGADSITLSADGVADVMRINVSTDLAAGYTLANADRIVGFNTGFDLIDVAVTTALSTAAGANNLRSAGATPANVATTSTLTNANANDDIAAGQFRSESLGTTALNNLGFNGVSVLEGTNAITANFTTQAGITQAVDAITTAYTANAVTDTVMLFIVYDNQTSNNAAIFLYDEDAADGGVDVAELTLVGVIEGVGLGNLSHLNFG